MTYKELKILKTCPLCGKELKTEEIEDPNGIIQTCECGLELGYYAPQSADNLPCMVTLTVNGKKAIETLLRRILPPVTRVMSERDEFKTIQDIVRELEKEYGTAEIGMIKVRAPLDGIPADRVGDLILSLKNKAELYEPRHGHYKIV
ncbi:hypothetical protein LCGC14_0926620 [marine sediment metagenome]|uniref:Uncharacterized protein n=1 Tax=marine sediment metagenome TaxID=412755 RepID=A0A0F9NPD2_9ZZZZ